MTIDTKRLRALLDAASPRPWIVPVDGWIETTGGKVISGPGESDYGMPAEDEALIVAAVNALPALLDLAERYAVAPEGRVDMACAIDAVVIDELDNPNEIVKQRVRLVRTTGESE